MTKLPPKALTTIRNMRAQISSYLQGVIDGMGVKGPMQLNEETGELTPIVTAPAKENDGKK